MERMLRHGMDYKDIIREAAARKLLDLGKDFLNIIDELRDEDAAKVSKLNAIDKGGVFNELQPFLYLLDDTKIKIVRKRVLDRMNSLIRELEK